MKWRTKVSVHHNGDLYVRGYKLTELIGKVSFSQAIFLVLRSRLPKKNEKRMLDAVLVSAIEHGVEVPSAFVARTVASTGNPINAALAAGVLSVGEWHGGAIEKAMDMLKKNNPPRELVKNTVALGEKLPGYGHKIYKKEDPRATALYRLAAKLKFGKAYLSRARNIERELEEVTGRHLPLNVDGAIAAVLLTLGFDAPSGKAFFILARIPGMMAHVEEEIKDEKPYRRFDEEDVEYLGPALKLKKKRHK